jgi:DNA polymerase III delta subunit
MKLFYYGNFEIKISEKINELALKNNLTKLKFDLDSENLSEIITSLSMESLFGDKNLIIVNGTESEFEVLESLFKQLPNSGNLILLINKDLEKSSKLLKLIPKSFTVQEIKQPKKGNIFSFTDQLLGDDISKTYLELLKLSENEVLIFNNIISVGRNLLSLKLNLSTQSKIIPFKLGLYKKALGNYNKEDLYNIYNNLFINELKFKTGEINSEMLLIHSVNLFYIYKNGNLK